MLNTAKQLGSVLLLLAATLTASCSGNNETKPTPIAIAANTAVPTKPYCPERNIADESAFTTYGGTEKSFENISFKYPAKWDISVHPAQEFKDPGVSVASLSLSAECSKMIHSDGSSSNVTNSFTMSLPMIEIVKIESHENNEEFRTIEDWSRKWRHISSGFESPEEKDIRLDGHQARLFVLRDAKTAPITIVIVGIKQEDSIFEISLQSEDFLLEHNLVIFQTLLDSLQFN